MELFNISNVMEILSGLFYVFIKYIKIFGFVATVIAKLLNQST